MRPHPIKSLVRFGLAATLTAVLVTTLLDVVVLPSAAIAAGPSVPLPGTPSTSVTQQQTTARPQDQASKDALKDDQTPKSTKDGAGNSTATSLSPSATWQVSAQTGDFTWSYPLRVPPAPGRGAAEAGPVLRLLVGGRPDQRHQQPGVLDRRRLGPVAGLRRAHLRRLFGGRHGRHHPAEDR